MDTDKITSYFKRKERNTSSNTEKSPDAKKKLGDEEGFLAHNENRETREIEEETGEDNSTVVDIALDMTQDLAGKIDFILHKYSRVTRIH